MWSLADMTSFYDDFARTEAGSAITFAQSLENALAPMTVGGPALIAGLILLLVGWLVAEAKHATKGD